MDKLSRRSIVVAAGALPISSWAASAPDALSRKLLDNPLTRFDQGGGHPQVAINRNFARIIEQNYASMSPTFASALWSRLSPIEREALSQCYANSVGATGGTMVLMDLLAVRLDGKRLGQVADHFGFEPVLSAVLRRAKGKALDFERHANVHSMQRVPGPLCLDTPAAAGFKKMGYLRVQQQPQGPFKPTTDMTPTQIYQGFRNAPVGGLSVPSALHAAGTYIGKNVIPYLGYGYLIGTGITYLLQTFAPDRYAAMSTNVGFVVDAISAILAPTAGQPVSASQFQLIGNVEAASASNFLLSPTESYLLSSTGGDYGINEEWASNMGNLPPPPPGGPCGNSREGCHTLL